MHVDPALATEDNSKDKKDKNFVIFEQAVSLRVRLAWSSAFHSGKSPLVCASYFPIRYQQGCPGSEAKAREIFLPIIIVNPFVRLYTCAIHRNNNIVIQEAINNDITNVQGHIKFT